MCVPILSTLCRPRHINSFDPIRRHQRLVEATRNAVLGLNPEEAFISEFPLHVALLEAAGREWNLSHAAIASSNNSQIKQQFSNRLKALGYPVGKSEKGSKTVDLGCVP